MAEMTKEEIRDMHDEARAHLASNILEKLSVSDDNKAVLAAAREAVLKYLKPDEAK